MTLNSLNQLISIWKSCNCNWKSFQSMRLWVNHELIVYENFYSTLALRWVTKSKWRSIKKHRETWKKLNTNTRKESSPTFLSRIANQSLEIDINSSFHGNRFLRSVKKQFSLLFFTRKIVPRMFIPPLFLERVSSPHSSSTQSIDFRVRRKSNEQNQWKQIALLRLYNLIWSVIFEQKKV